MRKGYYDNGTHVDTGLLRDHVSKLRQQKKNASRLYDNVMRARQLCDPSVAYQYSALLRDIEQMMTYFDKMADVLSNANDEAQDISRRIDRTLEADTEYTRQIARSMML